LFQGVFHEDMKDSWLIPQSETHSIGSEGEALKLGPGRAGRVAAFTASCEKIPIFRVKTRASCQLPQAKWMAGNLLDIDMVSTSRRRTED
jgi:hypothetical protein